MRSVLIDGLASNIEAWEAYGWKDVLHKVPRRRAGLSEGLYHYDMKIREIANVYNFDF